MAARGEVVLSDGRIVREDGPEWAEERAARALHVEALMGMPRRQERADYIEAVGRREGDESAARLRLALADAWVRREQRGMR